MISSDVADIGVDSARPASAPASSALSNLLSQGNGGVETNTEHRAGGQLDVLAFGCGNHAAAANQDSGDGALHAAENAADDGANAGTGANALGLTLDAFAFERLRRVGANVVGAVVHLQAGEHDRQLALAIGARGAINRRHITFDRRSSWDQQVVALIQVDHRGAFDAIL